MKLLRLASVYPGYSNQFYAAHPDLPSKFYQEQCDAFFYDSFRGGFLESRLASNRLRVHEIVWNLAPMQQAWQRENPTHSSAASDLKSIAVEQVRQFGRIFSGLMTTTLNAETHPRGCPSD